MKTLRILLAAALAFAPVASACALDRLLPAPRIKDNGDVRLSDDLKIGRYQGGKFISQPDATTGDVSDARAAPPQGVARPLSDWVTDLSAMRAMAALNSKGAIPAPPLQSAPIIYGGYFTTGLLSFSVAAAHPSSAQAMLTLSHEAFGSGVNGPATADIGLVIESKKKNYLTNTQDGEIETLSLINRQGSIGDAALVLFNGAKVKGTSNDQGGLTGLEGRLSIIDVAGNTTQSMHVTSGIMEGAGGLSGGTGLGFTANATKGNLFAAFLGATFTDPGDTSTPSWKYLLLGTTDQTEANRYASIDGKGNQYLKGGLQIGGGEQIKAVRRFTASIPIGTVAAGAYTQINNVAAAGVKAGDVLHVTRGGAWSTVPLLLEAYAYGDNEVTVFVTNPLSSSQAAATQPIVITAMRF